MGLRNLKRNVAKNKMKQGGIVQPTKHNYKHVDDNGNAIKVKRPSFFSQHWREG